MRAIAPPRGISREKRKPCQGETTLANCEVSPRMGVVFWGRHCVGPRHGETLFKHDAGLLNHNAKPGVGPGRVVYRRHSIMPL